MTAPSIFISHGSPMFALEPGVLGPNLRAIGQSLRGIAAVLVVSPHWQTRGVRVGSSAAPETIHDFGGFPSPLYQLQYLAPGAPELAQDVAHLLAQAGFEVTLDERRGLDHGAWVPLRYLFPDADVPVFQVSLPQSIDAAGALRLGQTLAPLRERGVLVVGSGSLTHNLYEFRQAIRNPEYAQEFVDWVRAAVAARDVEALADYRRRAPHAERAHPTEEHYLPLLVAMGASAGTDAARVVEGGMTYGVLSMDSFAFGLPDAAHVSLDHTMQEQVA
ncbi:dioxygenase [Rhodanobacter sp. B2A1Ga4]|uniref:dioxygenase family protein n=1 Tax=Rhodanobacter sp. B2A1Ga4 TaxID=2778647 RepID=UPI001B36DCEE|nr:class III extradiol ring-cleavage dioxygenase [Rhodanobacter sp. B2A1Ga4]MBQ4856422.1 dioxygenase [Rhodanobacter sp. B2A1Ga4]